MFCISSLYKKKKKKKRNVLRKDREREYIQGESWTVVVGLNQLQNLRQNNNW